ncbi:STE24 endopeptidase [Klenkia soli]|uniref:STE24 endopeptidase n=1 Tax=Klenkia soli TaxID=1052260 RepID=A0A1H0MFV8_9ACTN|nr:M48 family metalloprotease [Klenkia soli]SDO79362.1 STE24 endopeptidase [Klenkia soli]
MAPRRLALLTALLLGIALVLVLWLRIPWAPTPQVADPTAGLTTDQLGRADAFAAAIRPASVANLLLGLLASGALGLTRTGARWITAVARPLGGGWFWQVVLGTVLLTLVGRLVTLPLSGYGEVVRHRYGLSTRSWPLWVRDLAVDTAITAGLTALGLLLLVGLARRAPRTWWAWAGAGAAGLVVVGSFLYPVVIEPAFNDFTSMPEGQLRTDLLALADENGTPVQDVLVADASRRTTALNAYVSGFGSTRRIVVYDTVLDQLPDAQVESIAAHELGHVATDDVLTGTLVGALGAGAGVALLGWLLGSAPLLRRAGAPGAGDPRVVPLVLLLVAVGTLVSTPVQNGVSRQLEARADQHALDLTADPESFAAVMRRLAVANLNQPDPPAVWQWFFGSHPTTAQRVAAAQEWSR